VAGRRRISNEGGDGQSSCAGRSGLRNGVRSGAGAVGGEDVGAPFYRVEGGSGTAGCAIMVVQAAISGGDRPGVGGEWAAAVVRHNGGGGGHFKRGSSRVLVGSDEGRGVLCLLQEWKGQNSANLE
jgi:hypothetical protein